MELLLKFLIYQLKTIDGTRDSSLNVLESLKKEAYKDKK